MELLKKYKLEIIVFICGAIEMALELVAARIFAPYVGSSTLVWTIIIGMILIFMSLGYSFGGKLADKSKADLKNFSNFIVFSALYISFIPILETLILKPLAEQIKSLEITAFLTSILLFGLPCMFLAATSPYAVKLKEQAIKEKDKIGTISGSISSAATIGSIVGTFLTGLVFIPIVGAKLIILFSSIILILLNLAISNKNAKIIGLNCCLCVVVVVIHFCGKVIYESANPEVFADIDSKYARIQLIERKMNNNQTVKYMKVGPKSAESLIKNNDYSQIGSYLYYFDLPKYFYKDYSKCLLIGGAAYTYPTYFYTNESNKDIKMDVVEIDEKMTEIAVSDFELNLNNPSLKAITQDGRSYINYTNEKYDAIFIDAFKGDEVPFELTTIQAAKRIYDALQDNGVAIANIISSIEGKNADFLKYEYATYNKIFDDVKIYAVHNAKADEIQNIELIAFKGKLDYNEDNKVWASKLLDTEVKDFTSDYAVVTDDLAPIGN